jgi:hypothetical protein
MKEMKSLRFMLSVVLLSISTLACAQSDAQKSFDKLKTLAGAWEGKVTLDAKDFAEGTDRIQVTLRVTSRGNALMHEMKGNSPDDPITMFYLDQDRLLLTHFCDAGNRPRMVGKSSPDGKTVEFEFLDVAGKPQAEHMHHAVFTFIDQNHHTEDWTFMMGDKAVHARADLARTSKQEAIAR